MVADRSRHDIALAQIPAVMQEFMSRAVLYQEAVARAAGLNSSDLQCLGLLLAEGPTTPGNLARLSGLSSGGAITAVIDRLERAGHVRRERDPEDRRKVLVVADASGLGERVADAYQRIGARWNDYLSTVDADQVEFVAEIFAQAATINREEAERLRRG